MQKKKFFLIMCIEKIFRSSQGSELFLIYFIKIEVNHKCKIQ